MLFAAPPNYCRRIGCGWIFTVTIIIILAVSLLILTWIWYSPFSTASHMTHHCQSLQIDNGTATSFAPDGIQVIDSCSTLSLCSCGLLAYGPWWWSPFSSLPSSPPGLVSVISFPVVDWWSGTMQHPNYLDNKFGQTISTFAHFSLSSQICRVWTVLHTRLHDWLISTGSFGKISNRKYGHILFDVMSHSVDRYVLCLSAKNAPFTSEVIWVLETTGENALLHLSHSMNVNKSVMNLLWKRLPYSDDQE